MDEKVGKLWNSFITKKVSHLYEDEQIFFTHKSRPLKLFYHILGGDKTKDIYITDKRSIKTTRTFLEQISGAGKTFHLAWQDEKGIYLPASLAYFPSKKYNEIHYYWLVAMISHINVNNQNIVEENIITTNLLLKKYFGFGDFYKYAQKFLTQNYPQLSDPQYPNPLWIYPSMANSGKSLDFDIEDEVNATENKQHKRDTLTMKKKANQIDDTKETDGLLLFLPESVLSFMEQVSVDRQENDSYDEDAIYNAEELDEITLGQKDPNLSARVKMDLDIKGNELIEYPLGKGILIDEWDYKKKSYLEKYVLIQPHVTLNVGPIKLPQRLIKTMKKIQNELDLIHLDRIKRNYLPYGDDININTWIDYKSDKNQSNYSQKFFESYEKYTRNMSTLILADVSLSTEAGITQEIRVIDMIKDSLMVFAESLYKLKDQFSIYTFSSVKNTKVNFHVIKNFKENYNDLIRGRIEAIKPGYYTRMGAAVRESSKILNQQQSQNKLLLILSDGKPNDVDRYDGRYGIEDTKKAIEEAKKKGIIPFCITIDTDAKDYLPYLFGKNGYALIRDPKKLPKVLPEIYMNLTKGN
ncbi:nitric oxide reductase activation protein NorD [Sulfurimonas marina]|uniref:VWA domain-containing protein n=1 Tax=Sulfurimonas marina TaxID=2590551 RepID=A0A7M1AVR1_9BACT|nr:VWA domain-containing protein [Sulfurimonas marina]QOP41476.1 VWA domain-containing protein [Sulfurimonas marina]